MTTPAIRALRQKYPRAEIDLLVRKVTYPAVELNPYLNRVIRLNAPWTTPKGDRASWGEVGRAAASLRRRGYDCVVDFRPDPREALLTRWIGAPLRIGYGARGGGFCFNRLFDFNPEEHEIRRAIDLLSPLGVVSSGDEMDLIISGKDRVGYILKADGKKRIGIHPGAASPFKRWTAAGFARLGDLLMEAGYRVVFLGEDRGLLDGITGRMKNRPEVISDLKLRVLGAVIEKLDLLVGNDSAPVHIARAVGTRSIALYGPTHDEITGPLDREKQKVVRSPVPCAPCWLPGTEFHCPYNLRCWKELAAEEVMKEVAAAVEGSRRL